MAATALALLWSGVALATAPPAQSCQTAKNKVAGESTFCRENAEATPASTGDVTKCTGSTTTCAAKCPTARQRAEHAGDPASAPAASLRQYTSGGHVLGFDGGGYYVSNGTYALRVRFEQAQGAVAPVADDAEENAPADGKAAALRRVSYAGLWTGISVTYDTPHSGIARSTWTLEPGADPAAIRLVYNRPVTVASDGSLSVVFDTGSLSESRPVAWQEVDGQRQMVEVTFAQLDDDTVGFRLGAHRRDLPVTIDPTLTWNTFLGGGGIDAAYAIAVDGSGNVYVAGHSGATWGSPVRVYTYLGDAFAAKLTPAGALTWNTFLGGSGADYGNAIAVDGSGNVYVGGQSSVKWGSPARAHTAGWDAFAAKLTPAGALTWNTFLGGSGDDYGRAIAVDGSGNVYLAGNSRTTWGSPVRPHTAAYDAFAAKLTAAGALTWNTFLGGSGTDYGNAIAVDRSGNVYLAGNSGATWGNPVRRYTAHDDVFAAKLTAAGALTWNTFLGGSGADHGRAIAVDGGGNVYLAGDSDATWGSPVRPYTAGSDAYTAWDAFAAKLAPAGALTWNTFLGGSDADYGNAIAVAGGGTVYAAGNSDASWGSAVRAYTSLGDAFAVQIGDAPPTATLVSTAAAKPPSTGTPTRTRPPTRSSTPTVTATARFVDNSDGTMTDTQTGLMWEKKGDRGNLHDKDGQYTWAGCCNGDCSSTANHCQPTSAAASACETGTTGANTVGCATCVSGTCNTFGFRTIWEWLVDVNIEGRGGHSDWRIPKVSLYADTGTAELEGLLLAPYPNCPKSPCVGPAFSTCSTRCDETSTSCTCTVPSPYWSSTTAANPIYASGVFFDTGDLGTGNKAQLSVFFVRAVRAGSTHAPPPHGH